MKRSWFVAALGALAFLPLSASAQGRLHPRWEIPGFDFARDGVWRVKAREVARRRALLLQAGDFAALNSPLAPGRAATLATTVTGTLTAPVVMFRYADTQPSQYSRDTSQYNAVLFGSVPPGGNPYTLRTFYEQMSTVGVNPPLFSIQGMSFPWVGLANNEITYVGCCNGLGSAFGQMQAGLLEAIAKVDTGVAGVNFGLFDNDGPDGVPNSSDDDGFVDVVMFLHPTRDGACGGYPDGNANPHLWSHRSTLSYTTNDAAASPPGGFIRVRDYIVQSGLGGANFGCDTTQIMPIGTSAHELGHALDLPDLYDISGQTEGVGQWGLMSSGSYTSVKSPSRYEAWSLLQMGWITVREIAASGTYTFGAVPTADTTLLVRVTGANPRGEYYLLENRQRVQSDSAMIRFHCQESGQPATCPGGLLIWHVDSVKECLISECPSNNMNAGLIHGLALEQADGMANLDFAFPDPLNNRGDAGDPFPGVTGNVLFGVNTDPPARRNADGGPSGFVIDSIRQTVVNGEMAFRIRVGGVTVVRASPDTNALIEVDAVSYRVFEDILEGGSHVLSVADTQFTNNNRTRHAWVSWSDGGGITHAITASATDTVITATMNRAFKLIATAGANGTVSSNPGGLDLTGGVFRDAGASVELTATPNPSFVFTGWTGDTTTANATVVLPMQRAYTVTASFSTPLAITKGSTLRAGVMGSTYADTLTAGGGLPPYVWTYTGSLPPGAALASNGVLEASELRQTGTFTFTGQVTAGGQSQSQSFSVTVSAPVLATQAVVNQLLDQSTGTLTFAELRYLDLLGNNSGILDVGDFLAWVNATGAPLSAEVLQAVQAVQLRKGGRP